MEEKILNVLVNLQSDFCDMKNDISEIKKDVSGMKVEINEMKQDISGMKVEINEMKQDIKGLHVRMDALETKVDEIDKKHESNYIELRRLRQIDSNNIARILELQTQMFRSQQRMYA